jgi:hypothetical protein
MSQPKSRSLFVFMLVLAVTALAIAVYLFAQKQTGHPNFASYQIVYLCDGDLAGKIQQICIINGDGSGKKVLISGEAGKDLFFFPAMNNKGQIVYLCSSAANEGDVRTLSVGICAVRTDGSGKGRLDITDMGHGWNHPIINNAGQVYFPCKDAICFTTLNQDGSFSKEVQKIPLDPTKTYFELSRLFVNDKGLGVYPCLDTTGIEEAQRQDPGAGLKEYYSRPRNICVYSSKDKSVKQLTHAPVGTSYFVAAINNSGGLVFNCDASVIPGFGAMGETDICSMNVDGSAQQQLTRSQSPTYKSDFVMNDWGQIVFDCFENFLNSSVCAMNSDGSNYRQITPSDNLASNVYPSINDDGVIAYLCSLSICIMNFDGSDQRQLATYKSPQSYTVGTVQIR